MKKETCNPDKSHLTEQPMHVVPVAEPFGSWQIKKRPCIQYQLPFSGAIDCAGDMADGDFTLDCLEDYGTCMGCDKTGFGAWLPYRTCAKTNMRNVVCTATAGIQPHSERFAGCAGRWTGFEVPMTVKFDVLPSERKKRPQEL